MFAIKVCYGKVVLESSVRQGSKVFELYSKLSGAYLGRLVLTNLTDMASNLRSLQDQAASLMKHAWCCSKDVVLFVGNLRITPLGFGHTRSLNMTNKQVRKVLHCLGGNNRVRVYMLWDETDDACFTNKTRNKDFDVFGYLTRQAKRAKLEQNYVDIAHIPDRRDVRLGESNTCIAAKVDVSEARHHLTSDVFRRACALWGVQADFPDGTPCKFELLNPATFISRVEVVLGYFHNGLAILDCAFLLRQVRYTSVTYTASKPARLLWLVPGTNLSNWLACLSKASPFFTTTKFGVDSLVYDRGFVHKFKPC